MTNLLLLADRPHGMQPPYHHNDLTRFSPVCAEWDDQAQVQQDGTTSYHCSFTALPIASAPHTPIYDALRVHQLEEHTVADIEVLIHGWARDIDFVQAGLLSPRGGACVAPTTPRRVKQGIYCYPRSTR